MPASVSSGCSPGRSSSAGFSAPSRVWRSRPTSHRPRPQDGDSYLLPAFAAVFLGATQFRAKRFNAWGTILAVFMLATGQYGLVLAGAPQWTPNVFQGVALIAAMGFSSMRGNTGLSKGRWRKFFRSSRHGSSGPSKQGVPDAAALA